MAQYKNRGKSSGNVTFRAIGIFLAILIFLGAVIGCIWGWVKVKHLEDKIATMTPADGSEDKEANGGVIVAPGDETAPVRMSVAKLAVQDDDVPTGDTVEYYEITAETDIAASDFHWVIAYKDEQSEWAQANTLSDYVTLTKGEESNKATVACLQAFGEPVIVTAIVMKNGGITDVYGRQQFDYLKSLDLDFYVSGKTDGSTHDIELTNPTNEIPLELAKSNQRGIFFMSFNWGVGTVTGEWMFSSSFTLDAATMLALTSQGYTYAPTQATGQNLNDILPFYNKLINSPNKLTLHQNVISNLFNCTVEGKTEQQAAAEIRKSWANVVNTIVDETGKVSSQATMCVILTYSYNGVEQSKLESVTHFNPYADVTSVTLPADHVFNVKTA